MFCITYKITIKNLFRSVIFWLILSTALLLIAFDEAQYHSGILHSQYGFITDIDPRFTIDYYHVIERIENIVPATIMFYIMPLLTVISSVLILNNDYGNNFYEIEKSANIKPHTYILSRILALISINFAVVTIFSLFAIHFHITVRGADVKFIGVGYYLIKTSIRTMRLIIVEAMPCIIAYITFTIAMGTLFKNGIIPSIISITCVLSDYAYAYFFQYRFPSFIYENIAPVPLDVRGYMTYYGTPSFERYIEKNGYKFLDVIFYISLYLTLSLLYVLIAYIKQRKREI